MQSSTNYLEVVPTEIWARIFSFISLKQLVSGFASTSKESVRLFHTALPNSAPNLLNILVTGLHGAGSTTVYTRIKNEIGLNAKQRNLSESKDSSWWRTVNDNYYNGDLVLLKRTRAVLLHGATYLTQSSMMYTLSGACQCFMYVVPCGPLNDHMNTIQQNIIAYYALAIDPHWIFVINQMDLVQYSEDEYNKCVESIKNIAVKVIGEQRMNKLHFVPMSANDTQTRVTSDSNNIHMLWSNESTMNLWQVMNQIANESNEAILQDDDTSSALFKIFKRFRATVVQSCPDRIIKIYVVEGCISVGDSIQMLPESNFKFVAQPSWNWKTFNWGLTGEVLEIQSFGQSKQHALPNSVVAIRLTHGKPPIPKYHHIHYPEPIGPNLTVSESKSYWERKYVFYATIVNVGERTPDYTWKGLLRENFYGVMHSLGSRSGIRIHQIRKIFDKTGNELDLNHIKEERKGLAIKKGEKAEVLLESDIPLNATIQHSGVNDCCGRFVIQVNYNKIVAVGVLTNVYYGETSK